MKPIFVLLTSMLLTACVTKNPYGDGTDTPSFSDLPPIGIFYSKLSDDLEAKCSEYAKRSLLHYCRRNNFDLDELAEALRASGRLHAIIPRHPSLDYQVLVSTAELQVDDARSLTNAVISGATLTLVPLTIQVILQTEFVIMWRGEEIDRFFHEIPLERSDTLLIHPKTHVQATAKALSDALLKSIDTNDSLSAVRLFKALEASDYELDVTIPERIAGFLLTDSNLYHDPFLGSIFNFYHTQFAFDRIDVFIYPIRATNWDNPHENIEAELANNRAEIEYIQKEGHIEDVELREPEILHWTVEADRVPVGFMDGYYFSPERERVYTSTYIFIKEDKFVKIRSSFPKNPEETSVVAPESFVRKLMLAISVPSESAYMARLRAAYRDQTARSEKDN